MSLLGKPLTAAFSGLIVRQYFDQTDALTPSLALDTCDRPGGRTASAPLPPSEASSICWAPGPWSPRSSRATKETDGPGGRMARGPVRRPGVQRRGSTEKGMKAGTWGGAWTNSEPKKFFVWVDFQGPPPSEKLVGWCEKSHPGAVDVTFGHPDFLHG